MELQEARANLFFAVSVVVRAISLLEIKGWSRAQKERAWQNHDKISRKWEKKFEQLASDVLEKQKRDLLALMHKEIRIALEKKASIDWNTMTENMLNHLKSFGVDEWRHVFTPAIEGVITDQAEQWSVELGLSFDVQNLFARDWFNNYTLHFAQQINDGTLKEVATLLNIGEEEGWSIPKAQDHLESLFERMISGDLPPEEQQWYEDRLPPHRTEMIARTETIRASNAGTQEIFKDWGVQQREWVSTLDDRVRPDHAEANGQVVGIDVPFIVGGESLMFPGDPNGSPENTINCIPGETSILSISPIVAVTKRFYKGEVITISTQGGRNITATPNHPILTRDGWKAVKLINQSDQLICSFLRKEYGFSDPDINYVPTMIEKIFSSKSTMLGSKRIAGTAMDFHGDGRNGYIKVVSPYWKLCNRIKLSRNQYIQNIRFNFSYLKGFVGHIVGTFYRSFINSFFTVFHCFASNVSFEGIEFSSLRRHRLHLKKIGLASISRSNASFYQSRSDSSPGNIEDIRKSFLGYPFEIELDQVVSINIGSFSGHVYNLQTQNEFYLANGILSHNCRCTIVPVLPPEELERLQEEQAQEEQVAEPEEIFDITNTTEEQIAEWSQEAYDFITQEHIPGGTLGPSYTNEPYSGTTESGWKDYICRTISDATGIEYNVVNDFIHNWAKTSNDENINSLLVQKISSSLFGAELSKWQVEKLNSNSDDVSQFTLDEIEKMMQAMKAQTETALKADGVEYLTLYRGTGVPKVIFDKLTEGNQVTWEGGNAIESWSANPSTAYNFARYHDYAVVMKAVFPADRIVGSAKTGFGCMNESEYVVIGGIPYNAQIERKTTLKE